MNEDIAHLDFHAEEPRAGVVSREGEDGSRFELDMVTGQGTLFFKDGTYFRDLNDYDHGWIWRKPGMKYSQVRRSKLKTFVYRFMDILMMLPVIVWPALFASNFAEWNVGVAISVYVAAQCFFAILAIKWVRVWSRSMFEWSWYGHLYSADDKRRAGVR